MNGDSIFVSDGFQRIFPDKRICGSISTNSLLVRTVYRLTSGYGHLYGFSAYEQSAGTPLSLVSIIAYFLWNCTFSFSVVILQTARPTSDGLFVVEVWFAGIRNFVICRAKLLKLFHLTSE